MLIDARSLPPGRCVAGDVCIIGAGAAGITLARQLAGQGLAPIVLEAGGLGHDPDGQALFRGECVGLPYALETTRARRLGGSTNCWGGFCAPFEAHHFRPRSWIPHSGWPVSREELDPYYQRAAELCGLDPDGFDAEHAAARHPRLRDSLVPLPASALELGLSQVVHARRRFGRVFRAELKASDAIRVLLNATAAALLPDAYGRSVAAVRVVTGYGRAFTVRVRTVVLAAGAIETARLLLLSTGVHAAGISNDHGVVGRYFMEHPRVHLARVEILERPARARLYDTRYAFHRLSHCLYFRLPYEIQAGEGIGHTSSFLEAGVRGEDGPGVRSLRGLQAGLRDGSWRRWHAMELVRDIGTIARDRSNVGSFARWCAFRSEAAVATRYLVAIVEPHPNPDSRVMLGEEIDRLGMRRVRLDWRLTGADRRTIHRTTRLLCRTLDRTGVFRTKPLEGDYLTRHDWTWHHMGTARMGDDPRRSVVDRHGRVHGVGNLYVAGSAVFPTAGNHSPTFTLLALSLRLVDHLANVLQGR